MGSRVYLPTFQGPDGSSPAPPEPKMHFEFPVSHIAFGAVMPHEHRLRALEAVAGPSAWPAPENWTRWSGFRPASTRRLFRAERRMGQQGRYMAPKYLRPAALRQAAAEILI
jgi:hypothetical protein